MDNFPFICVFDFFSHHNLVVFSVEIFTSFDVIENGINLFISFSEMLLLA